MKLLLSKGADTNGQNDEGVSALQVAVAKGNLACVRLLLEHRKCNINLQVESLKGQFYRKKNSPTGRNDALLLF